MSVNIVEHARTLIEGTVATSEGVRLDRIETPPDDAPERILLIILSIRDTQRTIEMPLAIVEENAGDDEMLVDWLLNQIEKVKDV